MWKTLYQPEGSALSINTWGVMVTLAFAAAAWVVHHRTRRVGIDPDKMVWLYVIAIVGGLAGARLLHFTMATPREFFADPMIFFRVWQGGFALYGGLILASLGGIVYALVRGINVWKMCDAVFPAVLLGVSIGRLGCFFAGCCHGAIVDLPADAVGLFPEGFSGGQLWLVPHPPFLLEMTHDGVGKNNVVVMATQLYETLVTGTIFLAMTWLWNRRSFDGQVFGVSLMLYAIWRPVNEMIRGDDVRGLDHLLWLPANWPVHTTSQAISLPVFFVGLLILVFRFRSGLSPEKPYAPTAEELVEGSAPRF
jgi:phosphatidylglycerol:prolipoprotein diacylglycerol transferase